MSDTSNSTVAEASAPALPAVNPDIVTRLRTLLGNDVVLLPVNRGEKAPSMSSWQRTTIAEMEQPEYLAALAQGNIGVLLGEASGGLCAIDIDDDEGVEPFLELNPNLRDTLRSKGARGQQIWVRVALEYPKLSKLVADEAEPWGEWRADGGQSVIHGVHPKGTDYHFINEAPPFKVRFEDIKWPEHVKQPWLNKPDDLAAMSGPPYEVSDGGAIKLNHMFLVRRYMAEHTVVYDSALGEFFEYDDATGAWGKKTEDSIKRCFMDDLEQTARASNLRGLHFKLSEGLAVSLVGLLRTMAEKHDVFANRPQAIHVKNGMLCFEDDNLVLKTFSPEYYSRNVCPYGYDETAECPRFKEELLGTALGPDDIRVMQKWAGACLLGRNAGQRFLMMLGTPGGGKSTFMNILESVIGIQNVVQLRTEHLANRFELYGFVGKTLLSGKDVPSDFLLSKSAHVIKALVGHDSLSAEKKGHCEPIRLKGDFNLGITCNADLNIKLEGDLGAWRRRMIVIRYERAAPTRLVADFADRLLAEEGPGILRWMVEGAIALLNDIEETGGYRLTDDQKSRVEALLAQSDSVRHFVQRCVIAEGGSHVSIQELKRSYLEFSEVNAWVPLPAGEVSTQLPAAMQEYHRARLRHDIGPNNTQRGFAGFRIQMEGRLDVQA